MGPYYLHLFQFHFFLDNTPAPGRNVIPCHSLQSLLLTTKNFSFDFECYVIYIETIRKELYCILGIAHIRFTVKKYRWGFAQRLDAGGEQQAGPSSPFVGIKFKEYFLLWIRWITGWASCFPRFQSLCAVRRHDSLSRDWGSCSCCQFVRDRLATGGHVPHTILHQ